MRSSNIKVIPTIFYFFVIFFAFSSNSSSQEAKNGLHTDLRDLVKYKSAEWPLIPKIFQYLQECEDCRPDHLALTVDGPNKLLETRFGVLYGIELISFPSLQNETVQFQIQAIGVHVDQKVFLYRGEFSISSDFKRTVQMRWSKFPISQNSQIEIIIARWERRLLIKSNQPQFFKVYPIALGGFSQDYRNIQTPKLSGSIQKNHSRFYESREEPWYYFGFPFLGILDKNKNYTQYGLHATLLPAAEDFNRGYVSTGCVHMQVKDVYEVFALVKYAAQSARISIQNNLPAEYSIYDSPVPFNNAYHSRVADGSKGDDGLTKMLRIDSPPPLNDLRP